MDTIEFVLCDKMYSVMNGVFSQWLVGELNERGWSNAELARRAGVTRGAIGNLVRDDRQPGPDMLNAIAGAFGYPPEKLFQIAGILPEQSPTTENTSLIDMLFGKLTGDEQQEVIEYLRMKVRLKEQREARTKPK